MRLNRSVLSVVAVCLSIGGRSSGGEESTNASWQADPAAVERNASKRPSVTVRESDVPPYELPEIIDSYSDSTPVETWETRRGELLELFATHIYGHLPAAPSRVTARTVSNESLGRLGVKKIIEVTSRIDESDFRFRFVLYAPHGGSAPVFVFINNRDKEGVDPPDGEFIEFCPVDRILKRGYAVAAFQHADLAADNAKEFAKGLLKHVQPEGPRKPSACGAIGAWAWGASRVLDAIVDEPLVDASRAAVIGHSRGGKTALWVGANDERFSLVISNDSGCLGAALSRRAFGERIEVLSRIRGYWFCTRLADYADREESLPVDQHQLIAAIAPRAVHVASADRDLWADPRGEWLSLVHAAPAYRFLSSPSLDPTDPMPALDQTVRRGQTAYHIRSGKHDLNHFDWDQYLTTADRLWKRPSRGP